jgi:FAD/FMN-containing dehydrogenase
MMGTRYSIAAEERPGTDTFLSGLAPLLDGHGLLTEPALLERHSRDWAGKERCPPIAVARPRTTAEVAAVLRYCHARAWPVVVQGGLTGLVGGATPRPGELALSLERMTGVEEFDATASVMVVAAGTTLATVQDTALGSCTIGGNIATNAGGNRVMRYGMTRNLVLGLEAVLADGTVLTSLNTVLKDNAGYDLKQLFIGTEGTLGVVTRASLRLHPEPRERMTALVATADYADLLALLGSLRRRLGPRLSAFEAMWDSYLECATVRPPSSLLRAHRGRTARRAVRSGGDRGRARRGAVERWCRRRHRRVLGGRGCAALVHPGIGGRDARQAGAHRCT